MPIFRWSLSSRNTFIQLGRYLRIPEVDATQWKIQLTLDKVQVFFCSSEMQLMAFSMRGMRVDLRMTYLTTEIAMALSDICISDLNESSHYRQVSRISSLFLVISTSLVSTIWPRFPKCISISLFLASANRPRSILKSGYRFCKDTQRSFSLLMVLARTLRLSSDIQSYMQGLFHYYLLINVSRKENLSTFWYLLALKRDSHFGIIHASLAKRSQSLSFLLDPLIANLYSYY